MNASLHTSDAIVIGGGVVGGAIAYGLARRGLTVSLLDEGDVAFRAARANFGLVWVHSKGPGFPPYQEWSHISGDLWADFAAGLIEETGLDPYHERRGGYHFTLGEAEFEARAGLLQRMHNQQPPGRYAARMVDRAELERMLPDIRFGPRVSGASFSELDGQASPLHLLRSLMAACLAKGVRLYGEHRATAITREAGGAFVVTAGPRRFAAPKLVLAAGNGNPALAPMVGLVAPVRPQRGQVVVTERTHRFFEPTASGVRQLPEGTVILGSSEEEVGFDTTANSDVVAQIVRRNLAVMPDLASLRLVRAWGGLRVMTPDSFPVYEHSESHPGAFLATCHSGVTLAAVHAGRLAGFIAEGALPPEMAPFTARRFDVPKAA